MEFLAQIPLDQTAITIAMVAVVILFAVVSIIKGIIKTIITLISFTIAAAAFLFGFLQSPPHIEKLIPEAVGWMPLVVGGVCALLAMVIIQIFLGVFSGKSQKKKSTSDEDGSKKKSRRNPLAPVFGLLVGIFALYGTIAALRYFGTHAELEHLQTYVHEGAEKAGQLPLLAQAKQWLDKSPIATFHERIDFINTPDYRSRLNLAKLIIISGDKADLARASQEEQVREALKVPEIHAIALTGDELQTLCQDYQFQALFQNEQFSRLASRPSASRKLIELTFEKFFTQPSPPPSN